MTLISDCYIPLNKEGKTVRILRLLPQPHPLDGRIQCELQVKKLDHSPKYDAISYTWGEPDLYDFKIWLNQRLFPIRRNLLMALRALRRPFARDLWVDALCINQQDLAERGHQVQIMGQIYSKSRWVIVWLGTPDLRELESSDLDSNPESPPLHDIPAFEFIEQFEVESRSFDLYGPEAANDRGNNDAVIDWKKKYMVTGQEHPSLVEFSQLCNLNYWKRLWILQEICLGKCVYLVYGTKKLKWELFYRLCNFINRALEIESVVTFENDPGTREAKWLKDVQRSQAWVYVDIVTGSNTFPLHELLSVTKDCLCQDPRDKVFGLLGLAADISDAEIIVDYSISLSEVYEMIMRYYLQKGSWLRYVQFSSLLQSSLSFTPSIMVISEELNLSRQSDVPVSVREPVSSTCEDLERTSLQLKMPVFTQDSILTEHTFNSCNNQVSNFIEKYAGLSQPIKPESSRLLFKQVLSRKKSTNIVVPIPISININEEKQKSWDMAKTLVYQHNISAFKDFSRSPSDGFSTAPSLSLFITEKGNVGLSQGCISDGDALSLFGADHEGRRIFGIVRLNEEGYKFLGRAIICQERLIITHKKNANGDCVELELPMPNFFSKLDSWWNMTEHMHVPVEIHGLKALTCPVIWPREYYSADSICLGIQDSFSDNADLNPIAPPTLDNSKIIKQGFRERWSPRNILLLREDFLLATLFVPTNPTNI